MPSRATSRTLRNAGFLAGIPLLLILAAACASSSAFHEGEKYAAADNWDRAVLAFSKAVSQDPGNTKYKVSLARARLRASQDHFDRGKAYLAAGHLEPAMAELQQTVFLDPNNQYAADELSKAIEEYRKRQGEEPSDIEKMKEQAKLEGRVTPRLNPKSNIPIVLKFKDETARKVYDALSKASGVNFMYDERVDLNKKVNIDVSEVSFAKALDILMAQNKHFYKVWDENTILIADDNQQKHKEYDDLVIQTFYLSNAEVKDVQVLLRSLLDARQLAQNDRLNAITIRDTPERVQVAEKIIEANDKAKAELVVDVQLLEFNRNMLQNLGIDLAGASGGTGKSLSVTYTGGTSVPLNNMGLLNNLGSYSIGPIPSVLLNFLLTDADAQLIAKPQLRVSEGEKATVRIGDRVPIPTTTFNTAQTVGSTVVPITSFTYQNVGINIDLEPRVHHNKEVTLRLKVELSSLAGSVSAGGGVSQPIIGTREIETKIRLKDGETNLLAGLIKQEERTSLSGIPGLSQVPLLRRLFGSTQTEVQHTDIVLTLTPHIIRIPDITPADLKPLWIGTDQDIKLRGASRTSPFGTLFEPDGSEESAAFGSEEEAAPGTIVPVPAVPGREEEAAEAPSAAAGGRAVATSGGAPSAAAPEPAAPPAEALVAFSPPSILAGVGTTFELNVVISQAADVGSVPFHIAYDPKILQFAGGEEGEFLNKDGASTIFNAQASTQNEVFVAMSRLGVPTGVGGNGVLCTLRFQALSEGTVTLAFTQASVLDPSGKVLPASFARPVMVNVQ